jgi:cell division protein FtsB
MNRSNPPGPRRVARSGVSRSAAVFSQSGQSVDGGPLEQFGRVVLFAVVALGIAHVTALILMSGYRHSFWSQQSALTADRIAALKSEVHELEVRAARARSDRGYLEELARRQGFVGKSERVIVPFVPDAAMPVEDGVPTVPLTPSGSGR